MDRYAREDTRIEREALDENIQVSKPGRFYPEEYSSAIAAYQQSTQPLAEIPKALAGIVEHHNDFKINTWMNDQEVKIQAEREDIAMDNKHREHELTIMTQNRVYERNLEYQDAIDKALIEAEQTGELATDAVARVASEFQTQSDFQSIPMAKQFWANSFQRTTESEFNSARKNDRDREVYLAKYNMQDAIARRLPDVMQGRVNPVNMVNDTLPEIAPYLSTLSVEDKKATLDKIWSLAVQERGRYIVDKVGRGELKAADGMTMLRGLLDETVSAEFSVDGITDKEGNPVKFQATLIPEVQEYLFQTLKDAKNGGGSSAADGFLINQKEEFDRALGKAEIDTTGFTSKIFRFENIPALDNFVSEQVQFVLDSNASEKTKVEALTSMVKTYNSARTTMAVGALAKRSKGYTKELLNNWVTQLQKDLNDPTVDWSTYSLTTNIGGNNFELVRPGILAQCPILGNPAEAGRNYYLEALPTLEKLKDKISNGSMQDLLPMLDKSYFDTTTAIAEGISASNLIKGDAINGYSINEESVAVIADQIKSLSLTSSFYGAQNEPISGAIIDNFVKNIHNKEKGFTTGYETLMGAKALSKAFMLADRTLDLAEYARTHQGPAGGLLMTSIVCVDNESDPDVAELENILKLQVTDPEKIQAYRSRMEADGLDKKNGIKDELLDVLADKHIPNAHANWWAHLSDATLLLTASKNGNAKDYRAKLGQFLDTQYYNLGRGHKVQSAFFKHSPQMKVYAGEGGEKRLTRDIDEHNRQLEILAKKLNIPSSRYKKWTWYSDDTNKCIRLTDDAMGFYTQSNDGGEAFAGILYNTEETKNINPKTRATLFAVGMGAHLLAVDTATRTSVGNKDIQITPAQTPDNVEVPAGRTIHKVKDLYTDANREIQKDALMLRRTLNNPVTFAELCKKSEEYGKRGAVQTYTTKNPTLNFLFSPNTDARYTAPAGQASIEQLRSEGATGFAAPIDYASLIQAEDTHVGKIKQSDISIPVSLAAVGEEGYIDIYNVSSAGGYNIDEAYVPGVTMSVEYDGPTGMAAPVMSRAQAPKATGVKATPEEIDQLINQAADVWGVDRKLARALVKQESGGQQYVKSHAGAIGLGQLMPATAQSLGVTDPTDAAQNIWGAMKYLSQQLKQFGGDVPLALAAYNAGPGAVAKAKGIPNIKETKNYVNSICGALGIDPKNKTYPVTMGINSSKIKFLDADTGMLSAKGMNDFVYLLNNSDTYKNKVANVVTNRPELTENRPEYVDFKKYRDMKNADGKPLFVKGEYDGFKINLKRDNADGLNPAAVPALADAAAGSQTDAIPPLDRDDIEALLTTFGSRYNKDIFSSEGRFGIALLSGEEYENYGVPASVLQNPVMQARVMTQEFQRAKDILGSERKAVFALAGGDLKDDQGNLKSWAEVKADKENFTKSWYIQPSSDAKRRDEINNLVAMYEAERKRIRGF